MKFSDLGPNRTLHSLSLISENIRHHLAQSIMSLTSCDEDREKEKFCEEDQRVFTDSCLLLPEHKDHQVLPLEKAAGKGKDKLQEVLTALPNKEEEFRRPLCQVRERETLLQEDEDTGKHSILSECGKMLQFPKDEQYSYWQRLKEECRHNRVKLKDSKVKLPQEIHYLPQMAFEVKEKNAKNTEAPVKPTVPWVRRKCGTNPEEDLVLECKQLRKGASEEGAEWAAPGSWR